MNENYYYANEKLIIALGILATGEGDIRSRLSSAFYACHTLTLDDFPEDLKGNWIWIEKQMTRYGPKYINDEIFQGSIENTMSRIKRKTGKKIATRMYQIFWEMYSRYEK